MAGFPFEKDDEEKEETEVLDEGAMDEALEEPSEGDADIEVTEIAIDAGPASLESGAQELADGWQPTTPEGEQYKQELQDLLGQFSSEEEEEGDLEPEGFGFDIGLMGKEAAKRAMK